MYIETLFEARLLILLDAQWEVGVVRALRALRASPFTGIKGLS